MNILFLTQVLPFPLTSGARIRAYYMLRFLAGAHRVTLASFVRKDDRPEDIEHLRQFCAAVHTVPMRRSRLRDGLAFLASVYSGQPAVIRRDRIPAMETLLATLARQTPFDVIHADQTAMAQYGLYAAQVHPQGKRPRLLLDQHNAMHRLVERQAGHESGLMKLLYRREARLFRRYEAEVCRRFDRLLTVSEVDKEAHVALFPAENGRQIAEKIVPLPICVETEGWPLLAYEDRGPQLIHLGTMFWPPNVEGVLWFAREALPLVLAEVPQACFTIAGKNPPAPVTALAAPGSPVAGHVNVTGFVADPVPLLRASRAMIVPLLAGGGMRVKIVDGWCWGLPMVATTIGAEGIACRDGENILLADEPAAFAQAAVRLLTDHELADSLRQNGRRWVEERYNWQVVYERVGQIYEAWAAERL
jgi:glycosyltransferase involved in cell wall biosynthesis